MVLCESSRKKILPIASGKGGVGKSMITASLGILLAKGGRRTIVVDLDLGGSNLHSYLGIKNKYPGIGNYISTKDIKFDQLVLATEYPNLNFVPGDVLVTGTANLGAGQKKSVINHIKKLDAEIILLDLGSGTSLVTVDIFLMSNAGILVSSPQLTAILNAYSFLKNMVFRFVSRAVQDNPGVASYLKGLTKERRPGAVPPLSRIVEDIDGLDWELGQKVRYYLTVLKPSLILNMAEGPDDISVAESLKTLTLKNLGVELSCLGMVFTDPVVNQSIKNLKPLVSYKPDALAAAQIERIAQKILQSDSFPIMPLDLEMYRDSFELALIEARADGPASSKDGRPVGDGDMSADEFLEVITAQHRRIQELQSTIRMLTIKNKPG